MKLITREQWGARPYRTPNGATPYAGTPRGVKVHYLGTPYTDRPHERCAAYVRDLQASHMDGNGWSDIGYSFLVCTHGFVFEGRGLRRRNSANGNTGLNETHYAVCALVGNSGVTEPTTAQLHGIRDAIEYCRSEGPAGSEIRGHRDGYSTDCPGGSLYAWVRAGAPRPGTDTDTDTTTKDDMQFTDRLPGTHALTKADAETAGDPALAGYVPVVADALLAGVRAELNSKAMRRQLDALAERAPVAVDASAVAEALRADGGFVDALADALAAKLSQRLES